MFVMFGNYLKSNKMNYEQALQKLEKLNELKDYIDKIDDVIKTTENRSIKEINIDLDNDIIRFNSDESNEMKGLILNYLKETKENHMKTLRFSLTNVKD